MKCLAAVSFPQDVQHQKYQGVVWDIAIYRVVPLPSNTGKWRFGWEFPNLNMWCLASCEGDNRKPSVKMPSLTAVFSDTSAVFGGTFTEASGDFKGLSGWGLFLLPRTPKKKPSTLIDDQKKGVVHQLWAWSSQLLPTMSHCAAFLDSLFLVKAY